MPNTLKRDTTQPDDTFDEYLLVHSNASLHPLDGSFNAKVLPVQLHVPGTHMGENYWMILYEDYRWYLMPTHVTVLEHPACAHCPSPAKQVKNGWLICFASQCERLAARNIKPAGNGEKAVAETAPEQPANPHKEFAQLLSILHHAYEVGQPTALLTALERITHAAHKRILDDLPR